MSWPRRTASLLALFMQQVSTVRMHKVMGIGIGNDFGQRPLYAACDRVDRLRRRAMAKREWRRHVLRY